PAGATVAGDEHERLFSGAAALSKPLVAAPHLASESPSPDREFSVLHGLYWLVNNLAADAPVAMSFDDLHWSDAESLRFLIYLAPRLDGLPLAVIASTRPEEGSTADLSRLRDAPETTTLHPSPLSETATMELCRERLGPRVAPEFASACRAATGGNPFYLDALLREADEKGISPDASRAADVHHIGPKTVAHSVLTRLFGRREAVIATVRAVAVLGDVRSLSRTASLAELAEREVSEAVDALAGFGLIRWIGGLEFTHPIVREAVHSDIGPRERSRAHARAAEILAQAGASEERIAAQVA